MFFIVLRCGFVGYMGERGKRKECVAMLSYFCITHTVLGKTSESKTSESQTSESKTSERKRSENYSFRKVIPINV